MQDAAAHLVLPQSRSGAQSGGADRAASLLAWLVVAVGVTVMTDWLAGHALLAPLQSSYMSMKFNTALAFALAGCAVCCRRSPLSGALAALTLLLGGVSLAQTWLGVNAGIDEFFVRDGLNAGGLPPGRMAPPTAAGFILAGMALLLTRSATGWLRRLAEALAIAVAAIGLIALFGYIASAQQLYTLPSFTPVALLTAICLALLGGSIICAVPDSVISVVQQSSAAGRRLLIGFGLLTALMLVFSLANMNGLYRIGQQVAIEPELARARSVASRELESSAADYLLDVQTVLLGKSNDSNTMDFHVSQVERYLRAYTDLADTQQRRQWAATIQTQWQALHRDSQVLLAAGPTTSDALSRLSAQRYALQTTLNYDVQTDAVQAYLQTQANIKGAIGTAEQHLLIVLISGIVLSLICGTLVARTLIAKEAALRASERLKRGILSSSPDCIKVLDSSGNLLSIESGQERLGISDITPYLGKSWLDFWVNGDERAAAKAAVKAAASGRRGHFAGHFQTPSGEDTWWDVVITPISGLVDAGAAPVQLLAVSRDITQARLVETRRLQEEARVRFALTAAKVGTWDWDLATGGLVWSAENYRLYGIQPDSGPLTIDDWWQHMHTDDRLRATQEVQKVMDGTQPELKLKFRVVTNQGDVRWLLGLGRLQRDGQGQPLRMSGINLDITDRVAANERLRDSTAQLQALADNTPDILARFDRGLRHVFVNRAVEPATGRPAASFIGKTNRELGMPVARCDEWDGAINSVFASGLPAELRFSFNSPDQTRYFHARFVAEMGADGSTVHVLGIASDETSQVMAQRALLDSDLRKNEFLATLAHELRNPLAPIRNAVHILRLQTGEQQGQWATAVIDRQLKAMTRLIDDLLDISRISRGNFELKREHVDLQAVLQAAIETSRPLIDECGHLLNVTLPREPITIDADATRLSQVCLNLLNNAAKYTEHGGQIDLHLECEGADIVLSVSDTGIGIPPDRLHSVFDMFSQVESALSRSRGGLGIGLALVRRLVEMHGGQVSAASAGVGCGSRFTVRLPIIVVPSGKTEVQEAPAQSAHSSANGLRILVVDDNEDAATSLTMLLEMEGNVVHTAHDGEQAVATAARWQPDVVLCDIGLPLLNGYEVCKRIRQAPWGKGIHMIAVTGWGQSDDRRLSAEAGFDHHLLKPVDPEVLMQLLSDLAVQDRTA